MFSGGFLAVACQHLRYHRNSSGIGFQVGFIKENEKGEIPGVKEAMMSDAIGTTAGALLGSSTITTYVESARALPRVVSRA